MSSGIVNPSASFSGSLGIGLLFALISYVGFEATAIFRDEARTPDRTIPRATYIALILIGVFYAVTSWALISGWGDEEAVSRARTRRPRTAEPDRARPQGRHDEAWQPPRVTDRAAVQRFRREACRKMAFAARRARV